jgi:LacI family transcriptional regulator
MSLSRGPRRQVALLVDTHIPWGRNVYEGVARYARTHGNWSIAHQPGLHPHRVAPLWLKGWRGDGAIGYLSKEVVAELEPTLPVVNLNPPFGTDHPSVSFDDFAIGKLAAEHLLERGLKHFAYLGIRPAWSSVRQRGFEGTVSSHGFNCSTLTASHDFKEVRDEIGPQALAEWLGGLTKPVGIMACNDLFASILLTGINALGLSVPDDVAVIGVDNDLTLCCLTEPELTSVRADSAEAGFQAARQLDRMWAGEVLRGIALMVEPSGIAVRRSTDILTETVDPYVASALRFIRDRACDGIGVDEVVAHTALSRSPLQSRFRKAIKRSIHDEITRVRIERSKQLLADSDLPISLIADQVGISPQSYFSVVFRTHVGTTPARFRRRNRPRYEPD